MCVLKSHQHLKPRTFTKAFQPVVRWTVGVRLLGSRDSHLAGMLIIGVAAEILNSIEPPDSEFASETGSESGSESLPDETGELDHFNMAGRDSRL